MDLIIGSHVGYNKNDGLLGSVKEALTYNSNTFMFYTGAPQNTFRLPIDKNITEEAKALMKENNIDINNVIIHAPYIINLANRANMDFSVDFLKKEIRRSEELGISKIVLHPGSHVGLGVEIGLQNIIDGLNMVIESDMKPIICLETMAGKGSELGKTFEEIKTIIDGVKLNNKLMVCLDTCHMNDAGYDMSKFDEVLEEFDRIIGIERIGCVHINDSKNPINSHKDRHENIGFGTIGFDTLSNIIYNPKLKDVPKILETPYIDKEYPPYKHEIKMIRDNIFNSNLLDEVREDYR
ncbi:MAG: deoxyribonuclease IV [Bacilli bacterium]|nr:deoxyribonuclease IV [Bacilli bacterium]